MSLTSRLSRFILSRRDPAIATASRIRDHACCSLRTGAGINLRSYPSISRASVMGSALFMGSSFLAIGSSYAAPSTRMITSPHRLRGDELKALLASVYFEAVGVPPGEDAGAEAFYTGDRMTKWISMGFAGSLFRGTFTIDDDRYCAKILERRYSRCTTVYSLGRDLYRFDNVHSDGRRTTYVVKRNSLNEERRR